MKSKTIYFAKKLTDIPNIGKSISEDLKLIGIKKPLDLKGKDAFKLYDKMCKSLNQKIDYCMIDVLMSAVDFADNGNARKWWHYTEKRKKIMKN